MPQPMLVLRVVVASSSDVQPERDLLPEILDEVNRDTAGPAGLLLRLTRWEKDAYPGFHQGGPQGLIDPILDIPDCDLVIGIFWRRLGTPTPDGHTGTEHEFLTAYDAWRQNGVPQIMCYFCERPFTPASDDEKDQQAKLGEFRTKFPKEGLYGKYQTEDELKDGVRAHLRNYLNSEIRNTWGKSLEEARKLQEARKRRTPEIAILGRTNDTDTDDDPIVDGGQARSALVYLGEALAKAGCRILVFDKREKYASTEIVRGYVSSGAAQPGSVRVRHPIRERQPPFAEELTHRELFRDEPKQIDNWQAAFTLSLAEADAVVVVGNGHFTYVGGLQAIAARQPILALAGYEGVTLTVWQALQEQTSRLATDDEISLMARQDATPEWAKDCVDALLAQIRRRDASRIWSA